MSCFVRGAALVAVLLSAGACGSPDARFDASSDGGIDALADRPRPDVASERPDDVADVSPTVDVTPFDAVYMDAPGADVYAADTSLTTDGGDRCTVLSESYAAAVREAQTCMSRTDCTGQVCETLCCNCEVLVNPASPAHAMLEVLRYEWESLGCAAVVPCPATRCAPPTGGDCSSAGRCATLRAGAAM